MPTTVTEYQCNRCKKLYDTYALAEECETEHQAVINLVKNALTNNTVQVTWVRGEAAPLMLRFTSGDQSLSYKKV